MTDDDLRLLLIARCQNLAMLLTANRDVRHDEALEQAERLLQLLDELFAGRESKP